MLIAVPTSRTSTRVARNDTCYRYKLIPTRVVWPLHFAARKKSITTKHLGRYWDKTATGSVRHAKTKHPKQECSFLAIRVLLSSKYQKHVLRIRHLSAVKSRSHLSTFNFERSAIRRPHVLNLRRVSEGITAAVRMQVTIYHEHRVTPLRIAVPIWGLNTWS